MDKPTKLAVPLWPDTGQALGLGRNATYDAARRGEIPTLTFGRLKKVPWSFYRQCLGEQQGSKPGEAA